MLRLILFFVLASVMAVAAVWLADQPGSVTVAWGDYQVVTSIGVMVAVVLGCAVLLALLIEIYRWLRGVPRRWRHNREHRHEMRGYEAITRGLLAAAGGDRAAAQWHSRQAARLAPHRPGSLLLAAQTAQLDGRDAEASKAFRAMLDGPETELLGVRGLLAQALRAGDRKEALDLARRAYRLSPRTPWVLETLFELLTREGQWEEARGVLDGMGREKLLDERLLRRRRAIVLHMQAKDLRQQGRIEEAVAAQRRALKLAPDFTPAALDLAAMANDVGKTRQAKKALEAAWAAEPQPAVAVAWEAMQPVDNPTRRYEQLRALERLRPDSAVAQLVMGEAAIAARRLDDARRHLDQAVALGPSVRGYQALAELERAAGGPERARDWLGRVADAPPDRAWVCEDTGEVLPAWAPFGGSGAFDVVHWGEPPRLATLLPADRALTVVVDETAPASDTRRLPPRMPAPDMTTAATD